MEADRTGLRGDLVSFARSPGLPHLVEVSDMFTLDLEEDPPSLSLLKGAPTDQLVIYFFLILSFYGAVNGRHELMKRCNETKYSRVLCPWQHSRLGVRDAIRTVLLRAGVELPGAVWASRGWAGGTSDLDLKDGRQRFFPEQWWAQAGSQMVGQPA